MNKTWELIDAMQTVADDARECEKWLMGTLLSDGEGTIFGKRVRLHVEWLEDPPMSLDDVREFGRRMLSESRLGKNREPS